MREVEEGEEEEGEEEEEAAAVASTAGKYSLFSPINDIIPCNVHLS